MFFTSVLNCSPVSTVSGLAAGKDRELSSSFIPDENTLDIIAVKNRKKTINFFVLFSPWV